MKFICTDLSNIVQEMAKRAAVIGDTGLAVDWEELTISDLLDWLEQNPSNYIEVKG